MKKDYERLRQCMLYCLNINQEEFDRFVSHRPYSFISRLPN
jgi:hypothetical protein